jgi:flagellar basal body-associated protein FliL
MMIYEPKLSRKALILSRIALVLYRILLVVAFILAAVLVIGTVYGLIKKTLRPVNSLTTENTAESAESIFSGIGTIRIPAAPEGNAPPETLIVTIVFSYDSSDRPFSEELVSQTENFKRLTLEYLSSLTAEKLQDESAIKKELLTRYNALLRLGQIRELNFRDFIWL